MTFFDDLFLMFRFIDCKPYLKQAYGLGKAAFYNTFITSCLLSQCHCDNN